jgi:UDP-N-acetylmuramoyl-L-alanyl-D-glutamate--2,6-diaminopimelate ligase
MAVAADAFFGEPTERLDGRGVTGTNGKTTTTYLLRSILEADGRRRASSARSSGSSAAPRATAPHTTPEAIDLQRLFREMLDAGDEAAAIEASSHGSHYRGSTGCASTRSLHEPRQEHLDLHGDMEEYFQAKRRLFTALTPPPAAVNVGDRTVAGSRTSSRRARAPLVTFGLRPEAEVRADGPRARAAGLVFTAAGIEIETPLLGIFNVENVLARSPRRRCSTSTTTRSRRGPGVRGRAGPLRGGRRGQDFAVVVDYAHKPDALAARCRRRGSSATAG